jgi:hypothetical protein
LFGRIGDGLGDGNYIREKCLGLMRRVGGPNDAHENLL